MYAAPVLSHRIQKRGIMLVMVLWIVTILSLLMYSLLYSLTLETVLTSTRKKSMQAESIARAGIAKGFADLRNDLIVDFTEDEDPPFDGEGDYWFDPDEDKVDIEFGDGIYTVEIIDHDRYFNLRNVGGSSMILLQKVIEEIGYDEDDAKIVAAAIVDYSDNNDESLLPEFQGQPEGMAYGTMRAEDLGLSTREDNIEEVNFPNEPFLTVDSLLEVYGVTPELYFGPGSPEAAHYRKVMGLPEQNRGDKFRMKDERRSRLEDGPPKGLRDYFNIRASNTLNLNTAELHVLTALFNAAGRTDGDRVAEDLIRYRRGGKSRRIDNDNMFTSAADFQKDGSIGPVINQANPIHPLGVRSTVFDVRATATVRGVSKTLEVSIVRQMLTIQRQEDFETLDRAREREDLYEGKRDRWQDKESEQLLRIPAIYIGRWKQI